MEHSKSQANRPPGKIRKRVRGISTGLTRIWCYRRRGISPTNKEGTHFTCVILLVKCNHKTAADDHTNTIIVQLVSYAETIVLRSHSVVGIVVVHICSAIDWGTWFFGEWNVLDMWKEFVEVENYNLIFSIYILYYLIDWIKKSTILSLNYVYFVFM